MLPWFLPMFPYPACPYLVAGSPGADRSIIGISWLHILWLSTCISLSGSLLSCRIEKCSEIWGGMDTRRLESVLGFLIDTLSVPCQQPDLIILGRHHDNPFPCSTFPMYYPCLLAYLNLPSPVCLYKIYRTKWEKKTKTKTEASLVHIGPFVLIALIPVNNSAMR